MEFLYKPRRWGKTFKAVDKILTEGGVLIVCSAKERERVMKDYCIRDGSKVVTVDDMVKGRVQLGRPHTTYVLDNLDLILSSVLNLRGPIKMITWTSNE